MAKDLILIGGGAFCKACIDVIEAEGNFEIAGIVDTKEKLHQRVLGHEIVACDKDLQDLVGKFKYFLITIGGTRDLSARVERFEYLKRLGAQFPVIVSPLAHISKRVSLGEGTIVMHGSLINLDVKIGRNCIVNNLTLIEHDNRVGDHCHISSCVVVNGSCTIGRKVFIGSNSVVAGKIDIVDNAVISASSYVAKSIDQAGIYIFPAKLVGKCKI